MAPYRPSPAAPRKAHHRSPFKALIRPSPVLHKHARRSVPPDSYRHARPAADRNTLPPIYEKDLPLKRRRSHQTSVFWELDEELRPQGAQKDDGNNDEDCSFFPWDDERTLVADMLYEDIEGGDKSEDEKALELVDSLQTSFSKHSKEILSDVADTLVPAVKHVKKAYRVLNETVDHNYGLGIWDFHETCVRMEALTISEFEEVENAYTASKQRIVALRRDLEDAYIRRNQLWDDFEAKLDVILNPGLQMLKELPARMEQSIAEVEKQSKKLHKNDAGSEKAFKDILTKLI